MAIIQQRVIHDIFVQTLVNEAKQQQYVMEKNKGIEPYYSQHKLWVYDKLQMNHSYDILGAGMLWKPEEARILKNFINQRANIR